MEKKYELITNSSIEVYGVKLYNIRALVSFGNVFVGEIGGYIEKEANLDQLGNAWVYGDAQVSGDAWDKSPLYIQGSQYSITMCKKGYLQIGCECHKISEWLENGEKIAEKHNFKDIVEYRMYVELAAKLYPENADNE